MGLSHSPSVVLDGLVLYLDAANTKSYPGSVATARVYNRALSAAEVSQNFNATKSRYGL